MVLAEAIFENKRIGRLFMNPGSLVKTNMRLGAMPNTCEMDIRVVVSFYSFRFNHLISPRDHPSWFSSKIVSKMLMNLESKIIKLFHTFSTINLDSWCWKFSGFKVRPPRELNTFFVWSFFFSRFSKRILDTREITLLTKNERNQFENGKNQQQEKK